MDKPVPAPVGVSILASGGPRDSANTWVHRIVTNVCLDVLRDVLSFSAAESAEILDATVPSVNSALQRARASLRSNRPDPSEVTEPEDPRQQELLRRCVSAFETHDIARLTANLREDGSCRSPWSPSTCVGAHRPT